MAKRQRGTPEELFPKAVQSFQSGKLTDAEKIGRRILARFPEHGDTLNLLGMTRAHAGDFPSAIGFLSRAIKSNAFNVAYHSNLGEVLGASGDFTAAKAAFIKALSFQANHPGHLTNLGTACLHLGHWGDAVDAFRKALKASPGDPSIHARLGVALQEGQEYQEAKSAYNEAIRLGVKDPQTHFNMGTVLMRLDELPQALEAFHEAVKEAPEHQAAWRNLGNIYLKTAEYQKAVESLEKAVALKSDDMEALQDFGPALVGVENFDAAVDVYGRVIRLDAGSVAHWADLAFAHLCAGSPELGLDASQQGLLLKANDTSCLAFKSTALNHLERREEAGVLLDFERLIFQKQFDEVGDFESIDAFNAALFDHVKNHDSLKDSKLNRGLVAGQGTQELFDGEITPVLKTFQQMINSAIEGYKEAVPIDPAHPFLIQQPAQVHVTCCATLMQSSGFLDTHFHPPGWLSGVYYPSLPDAVDKSEDLQEGWIEFGKEYYRIGSKDEPPVCAVKPAPGLMVLFPSYFGHRTIPFKSEETRMSVAFDVLPVA